MLSATVMAFDARFGFNCLLKYSVIIIEHCSRIVGKPKMEEAMESLSELSNTGVSKPTFLWKGEDCGFPRSMMITLATIRSCFLEADCYSSRLHFQTSRNVAFGKNNQLLAF